MRELVNGHFLFFKKKKHQFILSLSLFFFKRFPVHGVSVNSTNRLINGDNKGYAAYLVEKIMNEDHHSGGGGKFVAAFSQSNEGDVSPNTMGAYCTGTDLPCDGTRDLKCPRGSTCNGR